MYTRPTSIVTSDQEVVPRWRSLLLWPAIWLVVVGTSAIVLRLIAIAYVSHAVYEKCMNDLSGSNKQKCECLANRMSERMVTYDYVVRRIIRDEYLPEQEVREMRSACKV